MAKILQYDYDENSTTQVNEGTLGGTYNAVASSNRYEICPSGAGGWHHSANTDKLTVPDGSGTSVLENFTFSIAYRCDALTAEARLFDKSGDSSEGFKAWVDSNGRVQIRRYNDPGFLQSGGQWRGFYTTDAVISAGNSYFIQISWDGGDSSNDPVIYVNNVSKSLTENSHSEGIFGFGGWWDDSSEDIIIGNKQTTGASYWIDGKLFYVALYNTALDSNACDTEYHAEVWRYANANVPMTVRGCVANDTTMTPLVQWHRSPVPPVRTCSATKKSVTPYKEQSRLDPLTAKNAGISPNAIYVSLHHDKTVSMSKRECTTSIKVPTTYLRSRILTTTTVSVDIAPSAYKTFTLYGTLKTTSGSTPIPNKTITVKKVNAQDQYIATMGSDITDTGGAYSVRFAESYPATYRYKVEFIGDPPEQPDPCYAPSYHIEEVVVAISMPKNYVMVSDSPDYFVNIWDDSDEDFSGMSLEIDTTQVTTNGVFVKAVPPSDNSFGYDVEEKTRYRFAVECKSVGVSPKIKLTCYDASHAVTTRILKSFPECIDSLTLCSVEFITPPTTATVAARVGTTEQGMFRIDNFRLNEILSSDEQVIPCDTIQLSTSSILPRFSHLYEKDPSLNFYKFIDVFGQEFDSLRRIKEEVRRGFHIDTSSEQDLDEIGAMLNTPRTGGEIDGHYRRRLKATGAGAMEGVTIASIKRVCELYTGIVPRVTELWMTGDPNCPWAPYCPVGPAIVVGFRNYKQMKMTWDDTFDLILKVRDAGVVVYTGPITEFYDFLRPTDSLSVTSPNFACAQVDVSKVNMCEVC